MTESRARKVLPAGLSAVWRKGRVHFQHALLVQALAELEHYGDTGLVVRDSAIADMRMRGSFAQAPPLLLPVRRKTQGAVTEMAKSR